MNQDQPLRYKHTACDKAIVTGDWDMVCDECKGKPEANQPPENNKPHRTLESERGAVTSSVPDRAAVELLLSDSWEEDRNGSGYKFDVDKATDAILSLLDREKSKAFVEGQKLEIGLREKMLEEARKEAVELYRTNEFGAKISNVALSKGADKNE